MNKILLAILIVLNLPLFGALASMLFGKDGIFGAIRYLFIPDLISAFRGEYWDDKWAEIMFSLWLFLCAALVYSEYNFIKEKFPDAFFYLASMWPT
ncbi:hypothetical protein EH223_13915 [candidate division KSB1 bacterium]|nr:MAG: hypothetical protein EH223_13915 [candidate division KSB1 bacterium]